MNVVFEAKSFKQIFDIWTNINDDYKIIDGVLKNLLLHLKQEIVGKKLYCCFNRDINNHHHRGPEFEPGYGGKDVSKISL